MSLSFINTENDCSSIDISTVFSIIIEEKLLVRSIALNPDQIFSLSISLLLVVVRIPSCYDTLSLDVD